MNIGVVGLGLIGGSLARAYKRAGTKVYGYNRNKIVLDFTKMAGAVDVELTDENMGECDYIFLCLPVGVCIDWIREKMPKLGENTTIVDCCGVKTRICKEGFALYKETGVPFFGGHPMAGKHVGGFKNSSEDMYDGAVFSITPMDNNDIRRISKLKEVLKLAGFAAMPVMTYEEHDKMIAFTSQMTHLVSNAFVKSDMAMSKFSHLSAGSFRDMTRVAYLDENMWTELFSENKDNLLRELDIFMGELNKYRNAIANDDMGTLTTLLAEGKKRKKEVDEYAERKKSGEQFID